MRNIVEPARSASRQSSDMPMESVLPPTRSKVLAASSKARRDRVAVGRQRADGHNALEAQGRLPAERVGEAFGLARRASKALCRRDVELQQDRKALAAFDRGLRERDAGFGRSTLCTRSKACAIGHAPYWSADGRRSACAPAGARELASCLLQIALTDIGQAGLDSRHDRCSALTFAHPDQRHARRLASAALEFLVDFAPQGPIAFVDALGSSTGGRGATFRASVLRTGPRRAVDDPMTPATIIGSA